MPARAPTQSLAWRSRAFGVEVRGSFAAPGLPALTGAGDDPLTEVSVVPETVIDEEWGWEGAVRLLEERLDDEPAAARSIDHVAGRGYRLFARHFGLALVSEDGSRVLCAPPEEEPWSWQRFLVGRILPWAALLRGREVFHASAVTLGGRAVAIVGESGAGKSSLAAQLLLGGARFLTDDVLALDRQDARIRAHPGASILALRPSEWETLDERSRARLGRLLGESGKLYLEVRREDSPRDLAALYVLGAARAPGATVTLDEKPDFRTMLASTFNESIRSPDRLRRHFELCADIAASVPTFRLAVTPDVGSRALAGLLLEHATDAAADP